MPYENYTLIPGPRGEKGDTGDIGATWCGNYNPSTDYNPRDLVFYSGSTYININPSLNVVPTNDLYWSLFAKSGGGMSVDIYDTNLDGIVDAADHAYTSDVATLANAVPWSGITDKPSTFPATSHNHDDIYYTESEINTLVTGINTAISGKSDNAHNHDAAYSQLSHAHTASVITADTTQFNGNLSSADDTVQKVLQKVDDLVFTSSFTSLTDTPDSFVGFEKKGVRVNSVGTALEFANSASNLVLIGHSNAYTCTSDTSYAALLDMRFILDPMRTQKILKFAIIEKGNGNCRITVTDGTTSVNVVGANGNSASYAVRELELNCSTLSSSILWTITVEGIAVSGEYEMRRFSCQADPANILGGYPLILSDPGVSMNSATATVVDSKYFPVNWAIDNQCVVHAQGLLTLNSGTTATVKVRLTTTKDAETTFEESQQTLTATGYFDLLIAFPSIVAPYVKTEVFLSTDGMVTLEHYSLWLEV